MAGGAGSRLWPASTREHPKQVLHGLPRPGQTLVGETVARIQSDISPRDTFLVTTHAQLDALRACLPQIPATNFIVEPEGKNTAPCVALMLRHLRHLYANDSSPTTVMILPADHHIANPNRFREQLRIACGHAESARCIVTLGITPTRPDTGYGYIERESTALTALALPDVAAPGPVYRATRFVEKPNAECARAYLATGAYLWNAGIFIAPLARLCDEFSAHCQSMWTALACFQNPEQLARAYAIIESQPIDVAIMEKQTDLRVVPTDVGWNDLGSWKTIAEILEHDASGNAIATQGQRVALVDSRECLVWSDAGPIGVLGMTGIAVIQSEGRTLVCPLDRAQEVKAIASALATGKND